MALLVTGCDRAPEDPVAEIEALVASAAQAAEDHDAGALADMMSSDFRDGQGRDRRTTAFMIRAVLGRYPNLLVIVRDLEIDLISPELATARMAVAAAGREADRPLLEALDADVIRVSIGLSREGGRWRVTRADWQRGRRH